MTRNLLPGDYSAFLADIKDRVIGAHISAARKVNQELVLLYWDIGCSIVKKQQTAGWGDAVVERLAADLRAEFPDMTGFSVVNLWRMKQLYLVHSSPEFLSQVVREMKKTKTKANPIGVAEYQLQARLPAEFKGHLPTARQLADAVRHAIPSEK